MPFHATEFPDLFLVEPKVHEDRRGYFFESYNEADFKAAGLHYTWVQDNQSKSGYGVVRGLHFHFIIKKVSRVSCSMILI